MKFITLLIFISFNCFAKQHIISQEQRFIKLLCADDERYKASRKFNRLSTLLDSIETSPELKQEECNPEGKVKAYSDSVNQKINFAKTIYYNSRLNAALQMCYFYYRIYDTNVFYTPLNIKPRELPRRCVNTIYQGSNQELKNQLVSDVSKYIKKYQEMNLPRLSRKDHARKLNDHIKKWNEILDQKQDGRGILKWTVLRQYKEEYFKSISDDIGLLFLTETFEDVVGEDILNKGSSKCKFNTYIPKTGMKYENNKEQECYFPKRNVAITPDLIQTAMIELQDRFFHESRNLISPFDLEVELKSGSTRNPKVINEKLNKFISDSLIYSPRAYSQALASNPNFVDEVCESFDHAFNQVGDEFINMKIMNGVEYFGPMAIWIMMSGAQGFSFLNKYKSGSFLSHHKKAIKLIMGFTALDLIWRGKNIGDLDEEIQLYEDQILNGNTDLFSYQEYQRLKDQIHKDKRGFAYVATYEIFGLFAVGRLAKLAAGSQMKKFMRNAEEGKLMYDFASRARGFQKIMKKHDIKNEDEFMEKIQKMTPAQRQKFSEDITDYTFSVGTILNGGISFKEVADTIYFSQGFPYFPQGISATN